MAKEKTTTAPAPAAGQAQARPVVPSGVHDGAATGHAAGTGEAVVLNSHLLRAIGEALYGSHWQQDLAKAIRYDKSLITRIMSGSRSIPADMAERVRQAAVDRIGQLAEALTMAGMPEVDSARTTRACTLLRAASGVAVASPEMLAELMVQDKAKRPTRQAA